jgi:hypothetical protein
MTALSPAKWTTVDDAEDEFGRPVEEHGVCSAPDFRIIYVSILGVINFGALCFAVFQAYQARHLATDFAESQYIFMALLVIVLVVFVGGPALVFAQDNNADAFGSVFCAIIFVICCSVLLLIFVPKMQYLKKQLLKKKASTRVHISGLSSYVESVNETGDDDSEEFTGMRVLTTKSPAELVSEVEGLVMEVEQLKKLLIKATERKTDSDSSSVAHAPNNADKP